MGLAYIREEAEKRLYLISLSLCLRNRAERRAHRCINQAGHVDRSNKEWRNRNGNVCWLRDLEEGKSGGGRKGGKRGRRRGKEGYDTRGKETYIAACAVRTLAEEFGRRLRSGRDERSEANNGCQINGAPHFSGCDPAVIALLRSLTCRNNDGPTTDK